MLCYHCSCLHAHRVGAEVVSGIPLIIASTLPAGGVCGLAAGMMKICILGAVLFSVPAGHGAEEFTLVRRYSGGLPNGASLGQCVHISRLLVDEL